MPDARDAHLAVHDHDVQDFPQLRTLLEQITVFCVSRPQLILLNEMNKLAHHIELGPMDF